MGWRLHVFPERPRQHCAVCVPLRRRRVERRGLRQRWWACEGACGWVGGGWMDVSVGPFGTQVGAELGASAAVGAGGRYNRHSPLVHPRPQGGTASRSYAEGRVHAATANRPAAAANVARARFRCGTARHKVKLMLPESKAARESIGAMAEEWRRADWIAMVDGRWRTAGWWAKG